MRNERAAASQLAAAASTGYACSSMRTGHAHRLIIVSKQIASLCQTSLPETEQEATNDFLSRHQSGASGTKIEEAICSIM